MLWLRKSLFLRLLFSYILTVVIGLSIIGIVIAFFAKGYIQDKQQTELLRKAENVNLSIQDVKEIDENTKNFLVFLDKSFDTRIWIFDRKGKIIATSTKDEVLIGKSVSESAVKKVLKGENAVHGLQLEGLTEPMHSVAVAWGKESDVYGGIVLHAPVIGMNNTFGQIRETIIWATLFGILFSTGMGSYLSWSISRPLRKMDQVTLQIGMGNYSERIRVDDVDEIGDLANTINKMAEKLEIMDHERKESDQIRSDFLANVSHELRTPLTTMQGFLEALQDRLIPEEGRQKYYEIMYQETIQMNRLVEDIMNLIRLENKEITLSKQSVDIETLLEKVAYTYQNEALEKGTEIVVKVDNEASLQVYADRDRLEQIIVNLVKNAMKFTDQGIVRLHARREGVYVLLQVSDNGIGISEADQEMIWERFFKVDRGRSRKINGTGLGLAIVKELVEMHQGEINVVSAIGKGSTFTIRIPAMD